MSRTRRHLPPRDITVAFDKIVPEGKSLGRHEGKVVFAYGVLPGETARVRVRREKRTFIEAELLEVTSPASGRQPAREEHYLCCSPWQTFPYEEQLQLKRALLEEIYRGLGRQEVPVARFVAGEPALGYRTKIEFSLMGTDAGLKLAFHKRGSFRALAPAPEGCVLAGEGTNRAALAICERLGAAAIPARALKSLVVRESKRGHGRVAALYVADREALAGRVAAIGLTLAELPGLTGLFVIYSDPQSPAARLTEALSAEGDGELEEVLLGVRIRYGFASFFQNHVPLFEEALRAMRAFIPAGTRRLVELYSGVGTIGLALHEAAEEIVGVEAEADAATHAEKNRELNRIGHYRAVASIVERADGSLLDDADVVVLDPPRAGLHPKVIARLLAARPARVLYLSCNPITQARDYALLAEGYRVVALEGFDFYPQTPHMESLLLLERHSAPL